MSVNLKRIISSGWTNFKRNSFLSFGTTGVMTLTLLLLLGLLFFQFMTSQVVAELESKVDISAYFKQDAPEDIITSVREELETLPEIDFVEYTSRDEALAEFKERHADNELIQESLAQLEENPLQASLNIKAVDSTQYASIAGFLDDHKFRASIEKINFFENELVITRINKISNGIKTWGLIGTIMLVAIAIMVTFNTIRLTIYSQKQEIEIMRLVGASNWHIRGPYLVEGAFYGIFAAIFALAVAYPSILVSSDKINVFAPSINLLAYFTANLWQVLVALFVAGILLGMISSTIAMNRHLKI
ncbi:MAG: hypothetical protein COV29_03460 [Candidatus Yanofskybacteria bacterium CG10_big_fil_rev_8_21_14_0_10_36_16]|uniref:Cell division protein FtsX n=1 Tax=Candidatus Yanofskybacteria bacterium CG10_big_fil_rev_8_21_14_0_10_36_16 TaxID=1975096 RepID=A0A2J0Q7D5_9BACT|nr:MAG: hypothetical protein COV29_03460 [Candidatus Yanofskybacteria bacterium CG10_big_fil_rev_8_21_14_0_10_36_16]